MNLRNPSFALAPRLLPLAAAVALAGGCGDDGDGSGGPPGMMTPFLYQCGPINCPLDTACVYDPGLEGREEFFCVEDRGCGIDEFIRCINECSPDPSLPDRECEAGCRDAQRDLAVHYGCPPPLGNCNEGIRFPIVSSPIATDGGVPLDPRDAGPDGEGSPAGRYVATFAACQTF